MPNVKTILMAKAKGLLTTLQLSAMQVIPPKHIGEQYNALRAEVLAAHADWADHLPPAVEMALYRVAQEALNNAVKHAAARAVWIELQRLPHEVTCSVRDDGKGFDAARRPAVRGLGLIGIRERLSALGGSLRLVTRPANGTTIHAAIPLAG